MSRGKRRRGKHGETESIWMFKYECTTHYTDPKTMNTDLTRSITISCYYFELMTREPNRGHDVFYVRVYKNPNKLATPGIIFPPKSSNYWSDMPCTDFSRRQQRRRCGPHKILYLPPVSSELFSELKPRGFFIWRVFLRIHF